MEDISVVEISDIKNTAMRYLARREYSRLELLHKLSAKYHDQSKIIDVLDELKTKGYQSDQRYADLIVRSRLHQFCGPFKIRMELRSKSIEEAIITSVIESYDVDWVSLARQAKEKHFGCEPADDIKELSKRTRYLKNKGFYQEHVERVLD